MSSKASAQKRVKKEYTFDLDSSNKLPKLSIDDQIQFLEAQKTANKKQFETEKVTNPLTGKNIAKSSLLKSLLEQDQRFRAERITEVKNELKTKAGTFNRKSPEREVVPNSSPLNFSNIASTESTVPGTPRKILDRRGLNDTELKKKYFQALLRNKAIGKTDDYINDGKVRYFKEANNTKKMKAAIKALKDNKDRNQAARLISSITDLGNAPLTPEQLTDLAASIPLPSDLTPEERTALAASIPLPGSGGNKFTAAVIAALVRKRREDEMKNQLRPIARGLTGPPLRAKTRVRERMDEATNKIRTTNVELINKMGLRELQGMTAADKRLYPEIETRIKDLRKKAKDKLQEEEALKLERAQKIQELKTNVDTITSPNSNSLDEAINMAGGELVGALNAGRQSLPFDKNTNKPVASNKLYQATKHAEDVQYGYSFNRNFNPVFTGKQENRLESYVTDRDNKLSKIRSKYEVRPQAIGDGFTNIFDKGKRENIFPKIDDSMGKKYDDVLYNMMGGVGRHSLVLPDY